MVCSVGIQSQPSNWVPSAFKRGQGRRPLWALQKAHNENAKLREALEGAKVALARHPVAVMDTVLQQNHQAMIAELVGDGFGDERTLRRHIVDWVEQVKEAYPGDTRK